MTKQRLTVSIADAAEMLGVSEQTISRMIKTKKLAAAKIDRRVLIRLSHIEQMLADNPALT
jgi:excisionase family DNA binding protein